MALVIKDARTTTPLLEISSSGDSCELFWTDIPPTLTKDYDQEVWFSLNLTLTVLWSCLRKLYERIFRQNLPPLYELHSHVVLKKDGKYFV